jgi:hypothetical protein
MIVSRGRMMLPSLIPGSALAEVGGIAGWSETAGTLDPALWRPMAGKLGSNSFGRWLRRRASGSNRSRARSSSRGLRGSGCCAPSTSRCGTSTACSTSRSPTTPTRGPRAPGVRRPRPRPGMVVLLKRRQDHIDLVLDVTRGWTPRGCRPHGGCHPGRPVFRTWPTTYRWSATIALGDQPMLRSRWQRKSKQRDQSYRRLTTARPR